MTKKTIAIIDLFAGPGGLGEGFSHCSPNAPFKIAMSVEYEPNAHDTLRLRSFYRKLKTPAEFDCYYTYVQSKTEAEKAANLQKLKSMGRGSDKGKKWQDADHEVMSAPHALGKPEKWAKIKKGITLSNADEQETEQERRIFRRVREIKAAQKKTKSPLIVIGGPPCQAYSVNGRNRIQAEKGYRPEEDERFFLYEEYLKVIDAAEPDLFVMENVEGMLSAKLDNGEKIFERIKKQLTKPSTTGQPTYDLYSLVKPPLVKSGQTQTTVQREDKDFVLKASDFGVPQGRKRVIILGVRRDKKNTPIARFMQPHPGYAPSVGELIGALPRLRSGLSQGDEGPNDSKTWRKHWKDNKNELLRILNDKQEIEAVAERLKEIDRTKRKDNKKKPNYSKTELNLLKQQYLHEISESFSNTLTEVENLKPSRINSLEQGSNLFAPLDNSTFTKKFQEDYPDLYKWLNRDEKLRGVANHCTRDHMVLDLQRYMFSSCWAKAHKENKSPSPKSKYFPNSMAPKHDNWHSGNHADRFRTIEADQVPLTITSHLRKDGHAQIHYDATQNRSMTAREAARIQTFPDDYYFEGSQGWQFQQVGNAVPPYLAKQVALHVWDILKDRGLL
jgi:DNA (cytosine-5)-methyltransferase 1